MGHAGVWGRISFCPKRRHTPLLRLTRALGRSPQKYRRTMPKQLSPSHALRSARGLRHLPALSGFFCSGKSANFAAPALPIGVGNTCVGLVRACRRTYAWFVRRGFNSSARPNHSFNRKQWGMPSFGPPFHYGPNAAIPHCSG